MKTKKLTANSGNTIILFLVKLGFKDIPVSVRIIKARKIISMLAGNPHFAVPVPSVAMVTAATNALETAEAAMDGSRLKTVERNAALQTFDSRLKQLQAYVEVTANGNTEAILSSGFELRSPATRPVVLPAPQNIKAANTEIEGQIKLKWKPVNGAKLYDVEMCEDLSANKWAIVTRSTKANTTISKLTSGNKYYFRVVAYNTAGAGAQSETAAARPN